MKANPTLVRNKERSHTNEVNDQVVDAVLDSPVPLPIVDTWAVPLKEIYQNEALRFDATHYDREASRSLEMLHKSGYKLTPLSEAASLRLPSLFTRIWAESAEYGYPYVNGSELMNMAGMGTLGEKARFLSRETKTKIDGLIIREGWLVITCSGTIGRVFYVSNRLDGWAATHDLIRVIPNKGWPVGFLHAYLSSPIAQAQILGHTHGGQIDHVTDKQIGSILIPELPKDKILEIHNRSLKALKAKENAIRSLLQVSVDLRSALRREQ